MTDETLGSEQDSREPTGFHSPQSDKQAGDAPPPNGQAIRVLDEGFRPDKRCRDPPEGVHGTPLEILGSCWEKDGCSCDAVHCGLSGVMGRSRKGDSSPRQL